MPIRLPALTLFFLLLAVPLHAQSGREVAREHFQRAESLFALGSFDEALAEYSAAFIAEPIPEFLFNIGQCHRNLKDYDKAIFSFTKYLELRPEAANRPAVEQLINELEEAKRAIVSPPPPASLPEVALPPPPPPFSPAAITFAERRTPPLTPRPMWKNPWLWSGISAAVAVTVLTVFLLPEDKPLPTSDLGNLDFPR